MIITRVVEKRCVYVENTRYCEDEYKSPEQIKVETGMAAGIILWIMLCVFLIGKSVTDGNDFIGKIGFSMLVIPILVIILVLIVSAFI